MERKYFEQHLKDKYPHLYTNMHGDMRKTCMAWGIDTGPGWYPLIEKLSGQLEELIIKLPEEERQEYKADQVKEKFGTLRFYLTAETEEMTIAVREAEKSSEITCQNCGHAGKLLGDGWMRVHCEGCEKERQEQHNK